MKRRYILILGIVGMVWMTGCGEESHMETMQTVTEHITAESEVKEAEIEIEIETEAETEAETEITKEPSEEKTTLLSFLKKALLPVGNTMYVWGGGWNEEDTGAGPGAVTIGVCDAWAEFAALQDGNYNYKDHRYEILNGLDCSGYVGWVIYNLFETESGNTGYVVSSTEIAKTYSSYGWGELMENPSTFLPGDIVSMKGHVWISLGMCEDGSVVLLHSSPPGVSICGMVPDGQETGQAAELAKTYMEKYYSGWQEKYPDRTVGAKYVTNVSLMRWNTETLSDAEKLQGMMAEDVLRLLFEE